MLIAGRWTYVKKSNGYYKAHYVTKEFTQVYGIDYKETLSPVACFETCHLLLALTALKDWDLEVLDVKTTFLFSNLDNLKEICMVQLEGFSAKGQERKVCCLHKAIYGPKQAALQWSHALHKSLVDMGFHCSYSDPRLYIYFNGEVVIIILLIYVNDTIFIGSNKK